MRCVTMFTLAEGKLPERQKYLGKFGNSTDPAMEPHSEQFGLRAYEEQLNNAGWKTLGTLAADALQCYSPWFLEAFRVFSRTSTGKVLEAAWTEGRGFEEAARALVQFRSLPRKMMRAPLGHLLVVAGSLPEPRRTEFVRQLRRVRRVLEQLLEENRPSDMTPVARAMRTMVTWERCTPREEFYRVSWAGAVLLSGVFGIVRGHLRACQACGALKAHPSGWKRKYCDACNDLRGSTESNELLFLKRDALRRAQDRLRKGGFNRLGLHSAREQLAYVRAARIRLQQIGERKELGRWEGQVAPVGKRGRPRSGFRATSRTRNKRVARG